MSYIKEYGKDGILSGWLVSGMGPVGIVPALAAGYVVWPEKNEVFWNCVPEEAAVKIAGMKR